MNCKKCGSPILENDLFCKNCGATVEKENAQPMGQAMPFEQPNMNMGVTPPMQSAPVNNTWANNSAPAVAVAPKKNNNAAIIIVGVVIAVAIFAAILTGMLILGKDKGATKGPEEVVNGGGNSGTITPTPTTSTYTVKSNGFTFKIPDNLIYQTDEDMLALMDEEESWMATISSIEGNYSQIAKYKNNIKTNMESAGYEVVEMSEKTIGDVKYLLFEISVDGENILIGYTEANSMYVFGFDIYDMYNEFNYDVLEELSPVFATAEYNGESNSIDSSIDVNLGQMIEGIEE